MMPVAVAFQRLLGPSLHLPVLIGAFFGTSGVLVAWWLGRAYESRAFGLLFAALVAISPLQIVWSRSGGICIGSVPHVLLVMALAFVAGRRASVPLAVVAGAAIWATLYQYFAARVAIPLGFLSLLAGVGAGSRRLRHAVLLLAVVLGTLAALYALARPPGLRATAWPSYGGYIGNKGERSLAEAVERSIDGVRREVPATLRAYFRETRTGKSVGQWTRSVVRGDDVFTWGMEAGGLALAPVTVLGLLGLLACLARPWRRLLWLALAGSGVALTALSMVTARRLLVLDVAWCAFAARGVLVLADSLPLRAISARAAARLTGGFLVVLGAWSFATVVLLHRVLPAPFGTVIPFGESGFGDGHTCLGCLRAAYRWQEEIAHGRLVVLFDPDPYRENRTIPGGLQVYGKTAALAAGRTGSFVDHYAAMANFDIELPRVGALYMPGTDFSMYLRARIEAAHPTAIVWDFEQPVPWERWLAARLEAAGGVRRLLHTPSILAGADEAAAVDGGAFVIETPWERRGDALAIFDELAAATKPRRSPCVSLETPSTSASLTAVLLAGAPPAVPGGPPAWAIASFHELRVGERTVPFFDPAGLDASGPVRVLARGGASLTLDPSTGAHALGRLPLPKLLGVGCAAFLGDAWWTLDPLSGTVSAPPGVDLAVPAGPWIGIARGSEHELVLASADQEIRVIDVASGVETLRFPAAVWPSRRLIFGECSPIVTGDGWLGSWNHLVGSLNVYSRDGADLGVVALVPPGTQGAVSAGGAGAWVAAGTWGQLSTGRLRVLPDCAALR
jgi:hypothetical protein